MKFIKIFSALLVLSAVGLYLGGCSSAEQTTAKLAYSQGDYKKAATEFEKETKQNPQNEEAWIYLAFSKGKLGNYEGFLSAFNEYKKIGKNTYKSDMENESSDMFKRGVDYFNSGESLEKVKDTKGAIESYTQATNFFRITSALDPSDTNSVNNASVSEERVNELLLVPILTKADEYFNNGKYAEAIIEYKTALEKSGNIKNSRETILNGLAVTYLKWGEELRVANDDSYKTKYSDALPYIEDLNKTNNKELKITTYDWLIVIYGHLGRTDDAAEAMKMRDQLKAENK